MILVLPLPLLVKARLPLTRLAKPANIFCTSTDRSFHRKIILLGVFSLGLLVVGIIPPLLSTHQLTSPTLKKILCAILNRYYNFTSGYGSLIYLNWYAGETSTAVIVANIPHCWTVIRSVFSLAPFKSTDAGSNFKCFNLRGASENWRHTHHLDRDGYLRTESQERIVDAGADDGFWAMPHAISTNETAVELGSVDKVNLYSATATGEGRRGGEHT